MALTVKQVETAKPGLTLDADGLYLQVGQNGNRSWIYRYALNGRTRDMGLGSTKAITLKRARELASEARALRAQGVDPIEHRKKQRAAVAVEAAKTVSFETAAAKYIVSHEDGWKNEVHRKQWTSTLKTYAYPVIGKLDLRDIDTSMVMQIIEPLWRTKPETASRVRGRIELILDWGKVQGYRKGENPARWKGHLDHLLPAKTKVRAVKNHAAVPYGQLPALMAGLRARESMSARALEFTILTAARSSEVLAATWSEFDLAAATWTIPGARMKGGKQHKVPMSARALEIVRRQLPAGKPKPDALVWNLSGAALSKMLALTGRTETVHGMRSSFKDWATDLSPSKEEIIEAAMQGEIVEAYERDLIETALAHALDSKTEAAYRRTDMIEKRRRLMVRWAEYCASTPVDTGLGADGGNVVPLRRATT